jgi:hypothetical protein
MLLHHSNFVRTPIESVLKDALSACRTLGSKIDTMPLGNYIIQSVFLRMTGFQEQKVKCICWDASTIDYEFRRSWLRDIGKNGECSSYDSKNRIYKQLVSRIDKLSGGKDVFSNGLERENILKEAVDFVKSLNDTVFEEWAQHGMKDFKTLTKNFSCHNFGNQCLLEESLKDMYEVMYNNRNRYAHNTMSYQENLPSLKSMTENKYKYNNFFCWVMLLILLDKVFISLYDSFLDIFENTL